MSKYHPAVFRLLSRIRDFDSECWEWVGPKSTGYGILSVGGRLTKSHILSFRVHKGLVPSGMQVMHTCDNRACVNPQHLMLGTLADNMRDKVLKNRQMKGIQHPHAKLDHEKVILIKRSPSSNKELAATFGVNPSVISRVRSGKNWRHVNI